MISQFIIIQHDVDLGYFDLLKAVNNLTIYIQLHFKISIPNEFLERVFIFKLFQKLKYNYTIILLVMPPSSLPKYPCCLYFMVCVSFTFVAQIFHIFNYVCMCLFVDMQTQMLVSAEGHRNQILLKWSFRQLWASWCK